MQHSLGVTNQGYQNAKCTILKVRLQITIHTLRIRLYQLIHILSELTRLLRGGGGALKM